MSTTLLKLEQMGDSEMKSGVGSDTRFRLGSRAALTPSQPYAVHRQSQLYYSQLMSIYMLQYAGECQNGIERTVKISG